MNYPGSKNGSGVFQTIINQIPPHDVFIEGFAGSGAISRMMKRSHVTVAIDICTSCTDLLRDALPGAVVINDDTISLLRDLVAKYNCTAGKCFVYLDPPYLFKDVDGSKIRSCQRDLYEHEFGTVEEHRTLLNLIKSLNCMVMISGYWSKLYAEELADWRTVSFNAITRAGKVAREWLWMNYPEPVALHDYSFLGENRTDRQRIKRKVQRWENRLKNMPVLEKRVLLQALESLQHAPQTEMTSLK
jgi:DNA adenine methylase